MKINRKMRRSKALMKFCVPVVMSNVCGDSKDEESFLVFHFAKNRLEMLASSSWSAAGARPPRPRPVSAKPTRKVNSARPEIVSYSTNNDFDEEEEVVEDDDGDDLGEEFGAVAEREHKLQQQARQQPQKQRRYWSGKPAKSDAKLGSSPKFRPSSAPARRPKSASSACHAQDKQNRLAASISIAYLRAAAEKKKARDREFARDLFREENEFKKKISVKIDQANKMMAATGSSKSFAPAPDRDGIHMIRVLDPVNGDRVISVEIFLREFEQLATVPLGQTMQHHTSSATNIASNKYSTNPASHRRSSITRGSIAPRAARMSARLLNEPQSDVDGTRYRAKVKPADRSQVQEELRGVLEGTIELTKILQEQLHELRLKGWNVAPRS